MSRQIQAFFDPVKTPVLRGENTFFYRVKPLFFGHFAITDFPLHNESGFFMHC